MVNDGYLDPSDLQEGLEGPRDEVDYKAVIAYKERLFDMAYNRFAYFGSDPGFTTFVMNRHGGLMITLFLPQSEKLCPGCLVRLASSIEREGSPGTS
jgi:hypothetical protein